MRAVCLTIVAVVLGLGLAGCSSSVTRGSNESFVTTVKVSQSNPITSVSVSLSDKAKAAAADNPLFEQDKLLKAVKEGLQKNNFYAASGPNLSMTIVVTDINIRSSTAATLLGALAGSDVITGDVTILDKKGQVADQFTVKASSSVGGLYTGAGTLVSGNGTVRTSWLYGAFSDEVQIGLNSAQVVTPKATQTVCRQDTSPDVSDCVGVPATQTPGTQ